jgi:putative NADPH-quinone reductase
VLRIGGGGVPQFFTKRWYDLVMGNYTIVVGHPDASAGRLNRALADCYAQAAAAAGHAVRRIDVANLDFPLLRSAQEFASGHPAPAIADAQRDIAWADHLAFFFPLWTGDVPALFKAFIEQTFRPGFAVAAGGRGFPKGLLGGKSARIVVTMGMPAAFYRTIFGAHSLKSLELNLRMCGIEPIQATLIGGVEQARERTRSRWFRQIAWLARHDGTRKPPIDGVARVVAGAGLIAIGAAAAYGAYAATAWVRFGNGKRRRCLLDDVMPEYDVRLHHQIKIHAPAAVAFDAIQHADFDRSPVVQALFRAREILLGARHAPTALPHGLSAQLETLGWRIIASEPGRELVFGTVTQPWQANPRFQGLTSQEFVRFDTPGYAKLALTLRVDSLGDGMSLAQTETRVQTTDSASHARFRRYWALVAPGIELVRIVLLAQVKAAAEGTASVRGASPA